MYISCDYDIVIKERGSEWEGERWNYCNTIPEQLKCGEKRNRVSIPQPKVRHLYLWHLRLYCGLWPPPLCHWCISLTPLVYLPPPPPLGSGFFGSWSWYSSLFPRLYNTKSPLFVRNYVYRLGISSHLFIHLFLPLLSLQQYLLSSSNQLQRF